MTIDLDGIGNRILSLPIPARNYGNLIAGKTGVIYLAEGSPIGRPSDESGGARHSMRCGGSRWRSGRPESVLSDIDGFTVSADGSKVMYARHGSWTRSPRQTS